MATTRSGRVRAQSSPEGVCRFSWSGKRGEQGGRGGFPSTGVWQGKEAALGRKLGVGKRKGRRAGAVHWHSERIAKSEAPIVNVRLPGGAVKHRTPKQQQQGGAGGTAGSQRKGEGPTTTHEMVGREQGTAGGRKVQAGAHKSRLSVWRWWQVGQGQGRGLGRQRRHTRKGRLG